MLLRGRIVRRQQPFYVLDLFFDSECIEAIDDAVYQRQSVNYDQAVVDQAVVFAVQGDIQPVE